MRVLQIERHMPKKVAFEKCDFENLFLHRVPVVISVLFCVNVLIVNSCNTVIITL